MYSTWKLFNLKIQMILTSQTIATWTHSEMNHQWFLWRSRMTIFCDNISSQVPWIIELGRISIFLSAKMEKMKKLGWLAKQNTSCLKTKEAHRLFQEGQSTGSLKSKTISFLELKSLGFYTFQEKIKLHQSSYISVCTCVCVCWYRYTHCAFYVYFN